MAGIKISALPAVLSALLTDYFPVVQASTTSRETLQQVMTLFQANITNLTGLTGAIEAPTFIGDSLGNPVVAFSYTGSAVNYLSIFNNTASNPPEIRATGSDTNIPIFIFGKGTGGITLASPTSSIPLILAPNSGSVNFNASFSIPTLTASRIYTFPDASGTVAFTSAIPSFPLSLANGGTNAALSASNGGIVWSNATQLQVLGGTATARQVLLSGSTATPTWSTATYPATTTINQLLYSSSANTITGLATANNGVVITSAGGVPSISSTLPTLVQQNNTVMGTNSALLISASAPASSLAIDSTGRTQSSNNTLFIAGPTGNLSNVTGDGTNYTVIFGTASTNIGSAYDTTTGIFTAPVTGTYFFCSNISLSGILVGHTSLNGFFQQTGSSGTATYQLAANPFAMSSSGALTYGGSMIYPLVAGDTVTVHLIVSGSTKVIGIVAVATIFRGYLLV